MRVSCLVSSIVSIGVALVLNGCGSTTAPPVMRTFKKIKLGDKVALGAYLADVEKGVSAKTKNVLAVPGESSAPKSLTHQVVHVVPDAVGDGVAIFEQPTYQPLSAMYTYVMAAVYGLMRGITDFTGMDVEVLSGADCRAAMLGVFLEFPNMDQEVLRSVYPGVDLDDWEVLLSLELAESIANNDEAAVVRGLVLARVQFKNSKPKGADGVQEFGKLNAECVRIKTQPTVNGQPSSLAQLTQMPPQAFLNHMERNDAVAAVVAGGPKTTPSAGLKAYLEELDKRGDVKLYSLLSKVPSEIYAQPALKHDAAWLDAASVTGDTSMRVTGTRSVKASHMALLSFALTTMHTITPNDVDLTATGLIRTVLGEAQCRQAIYGSFIRLPNMSKDAIKTLFNTPSTGKKALPSSATNLPDLENSLVFFGTRVWDAAIYDDELAIGKGFLMAAVEPTGRAFSSKKDPEFLRLEKTKVTCVRLNLVYDQYRRPVFMSQLGKLAVKLPSAALASNTPLPDPLDSLKVEPERDGSSGEEDPEDPTSVLGDIPTDIFSPDEIKAYGVRLNELALQAKKKATTFDPSRPVSHGAGDYEIFAISTQRLMAGDKVKKAEFMFPRGAFTGQLYKYYFAIQQKRIASTLRFSRQAVDSREYLDTGVFLYSTYLDNTIRSITGDGQNTRVLVPAAEAFKFREVDGKASVEKRVLCFFDVGRDNAVGQFDSVWGYTSFKLECAEVSLL